MIFFGWNNLMIQSIFFCSITTKVIPIGVYWDEKSYLLAGPLTAILSWEPKWPPVKREIFFSDMESFSGSTWVNICEGKTTLFRTIFRDLCDLVRFSPTRFWQTWVIPSVTISLLVLGTNLYTTLKGKDNGKNTLAGRPFPSWMSFFQGFLRC